MDKYTVDIKLHMYMGYLLKGGMHNRQTICHCVHNIMKKCSSTCIIKKFGSACTSYWYVGIGYIQNGPVYISYKSSYTKTTAEECKTLTEK